MKVCTLTELIHFGPILDHKVLEQLTNIGIHLILDCSTKKERQNFSKQQNAAISEAEKNGIKYNSFGINKNQKRKNIEMIAMIKQLAAWPANSGKVYVCCTEGRNRSALVAGLLFSYAYCLRFEVVLEQMKNSYELANRTDKKVITEPEFLGQFEDLVNVTELNDKLYRVDISDCISDDEIESTSKVVTRIIDFIFDKPDEERNRIIMKLDKLGLHLLAINENKYLQWGWNITKLHLNAWWLNSHPDQIKHRTELLEKEKDQKTNN